MKPFAAAPGIAVLGTLLLIAMPGCAKALPLSGKWIPAPGQAQATNSECHRWAGVDFTDNAVIINEDTSHIIANTPVHYEDKLGGISYRFFTGLVGFSETGRKSLLDNGGDPNADHYMVIFPDQSVWIFEPEAAGLKMVIPDLCHLVRPK